MKYISEIYYENLYHELLDELSSGDIFLKELLSECVFEDINNLDKNMPLGKRLLVYKQVLNKFAEGWQWPYTTRKQKGEESGLLRLIVGKEGRERLRKISTKVLNMLDEFETFKNNTIEKIKSRKKLGITIAATLFVAIILKKAYNMYQKHSYGSCAKFSGKERTLCQMKMLEGYREMLVKQIDNCNITSNPGKCQEKLGKAIKKIDEKLVELAEQLS